MGSVPAQLATLAGVIVGTLGSLLIARFTIRQTWSRTADRELRERRAEAYSEYMLSLKSKVMTLARKVGLRGVLVRFRPVLGEDLDRALVAAELERASLWERVLLVGSAPTLSAAQACNVAAREMEQLLGREDLDQRHWDDAVVKFKDARRDFHQAARIDMGVVGAPPKDMSWTW
jgi:hypothetical protein